MSTLLKSHNGRAKFRKNRETERRQRAKPTDVQRMVSRTVRYHSAFNVSITRRFTKIVLIHDDRARPFNLYPREFLEKCLLPTGGLFVIHAVDSIGTWTADYHRILGLFY